MTQRDTFLQFGIALIIFALLSLFIKVPGYMDAEYYTLSAAQISSGKGLTQPILWNYLDEPAGLPHPSHTYWMPAPSLVAAAGMLLSGKTDFASGRIPFLFFAALMAPASGWMGYRFSKRRSVAWLAAGLAVFCGYYAPYTATVDSFFLVMAGAWLFFFSIDYIYQRSIRTYILPWLLLGAASGWMHLNRADGLLWLALAIGVWLFLVAIPKQGKLYTRHWVCLLVIFGGYFAVTAFWYIHNLTEFSSLFPPHSGRALWMTAYNELFSYPPEQLTFTRWFATGFKAILDDRMAALDHNNLVLSAVQGMIFLLPLWILALWKRRKDFLIRCALGMEITILLVMSFIFPYSGMRGGFLHSSAALQPLLWGLAAAGAMDAIQWAGSKRKWNIQAAEKVLLPGIVLISGLVSAFIFQMVVIGSNPNAPAWEESSRSAEAVRDLLQQYQLPATTRILINNPAGYSLITGAEALVIPDGSPASTLAVAEKFQANILVLEMNHVAGLDTLYKNPQGNPDFQLFDSKDDIKLFKVLRKTGGAE